MKKITLWLFALFTCWQLSAQTTVTIGAGTNNATGGTNGNPIYRSSAASTFNFSQSIQLLTAADLATAGVTPGSTITKIAFYKNDAFTMAAGRTATMNIYLKNSSATALTTASNFATWTTGSTNCYTNAAIGAADFPAAAGWVEYTFSTPFNYTGGSIETAIDWAVNTGTGSATTGAFSWLYTTSTAIQAVGNSAGAAIGTANLGTSQLRQYNTQLTYTNSPCTGTPAPGNTLAPATVCDGASVPLSLQNATIGTGVTYQWYMNAVAISGAISSTYTIPSLTASASYYCEVTCGGNTVASNPVLLNPSIVSALPWTEGFEGLAIGNDIFPSCWGFANTSSVWNIETTPVANTGVNSLGRTWSTDGWAFTPSMALTAGTSYRFSYYMRTQDTTVGYDVTTAVGTGKTALDMTTTLGTPLTGYQGPSWNKFNFEFTPTATGNYTFGIHVVAPNPPNGINFDDFTVELSPTCPDQTGLVVGGVTATGANTSWDDLAAGGALGYEYAITTSATPPASGTATAATFYVASGLSPQTVYYLHVRATCTAGTFGNWATTTFTTGCAPITTYPSLEPFATFLPNQCWSQGDGGDLTVGPATFGANGFYTDGFGNNGFTGSFAYNIWVATANDWVISPEFAIPASGYELKFDAAAVNYGATTPVTNWEADDFVEVLVSSTGTTNWTVLYTYNDSNVPANTGTLNVIDLDAYNGQTVRFAYRVVEGAANGAADLEFSIDNFEVRLSPTCPDQTGLTVGTVTATTADVSWADLTGSGALGYEYAITTSATPPAAGTATTALFYSASSLTPQTVYYLHVRASCAASTFGNWATTTFTTACAPIATLPWIQNFDSVTVPAIPTCWFEENGDYVTAVAGTYNTPRSGANYLRDSWAATNEYMWTPGFDLVAGTSYDFSSWIQGDGFTGWTVDYFVNSTQNSTGATQLGGQYAVPGTGTIALQPYAQVTRSFVPSTSGTYYFAFRVNQPSGTPWYVAFDDVEVKLSPACPSPSPSASNIANVSADLSWAVVPSAALGYEYVLDNVATDPAGAGTSTLATTYNATGLTQLTTYYFHIRSVCSAGTFSPWSTVSFTTLPTPPANDNLCNATVLTVGTPTGITNTLVGATAQTSEPVGACFNGGINGSVWFSFVAPTSGSVDVTTDFAGGSLLDGDTEIAVYAANGVTCSNLTTLGAALGCDQDGGTTVNFSSFLSLTGLIAGDTYYVQVDRWGTATPGTFGIQVSAVLNSESFDKSTFVAYPNPVKDVLNLSYKSAISNVKVINLLGQEVLNVKSNTNDVQVNMSALNAGAYIVNITVEDTVHTIKVIKE